MANGSPRRVHRLQAGFTYVAAMVLVAVVGVALAAQLEVWSHTRQREQELELLWTGKQFKDAIGLYYQRSPGLVKRFPAELEDLIEDKRSLTTQRYLRRIYADPLTGRSEWGLVRTNDGRIAGIYSLSDRRPIKISGFDRELAEFEGADRYAQWQFVYRP
jgi:type II secretory pathway pseudopilin PulG